MKVRVLLRNVAADENENEDETKTAVLRIRQFAVDAEHGVGKTYATMLLSPLRPGSAWSGLCALAACGALLAACGGSSSTLPPTSTSDAGPDTGTSQDQDTGTQTDDAGDAGSTTPDSGGLDSSVPLNVQIGPPVNPGQDMVAGGTVCTSASYTLYSTVGEGPGYNGVMKSPNNTLIAGLLGTTTTQP